MYGLIPEGAIKRAIQEGHFDIYYQPKIDKNNNVINYEALCRWTNPNVSDRIEGRAPCPDEFFHTAKIEGSILPLSVHIVRQIVKDIDKYKQLSKVSINISSRELQNDDHLFTLLDVIGDSRIERVKFEATEDASYNDAAIANINWLKKRGFLFGLDDFGKAYNASLYNLLILNPNFVKFDRSLVANVHSYFLHRQFCHKLVSFFQEDMKVFVTAEGVETKEQMDVLVEIGFDFFQGYYISRPLPPEQLFSCDPLNL